MSIRRILALGAFLLVMMALGDGASAASAADGQTKAAAARPLIVVTADPRETGRRVPRSFLGFSQEYSQIELYTGNPQTGVNPITAKLFDTLGDFGGGAPSLRVGGGSTDDAWWNPLGRHPAPHGIYLHLRPSLLSGLKAFTRATGSRALLGVNLGAEDPRIAAEWAAAARSALGRRYLSGFEIGNEPEYYPRRFWRDDSGRRRPFRPKATWGPAAYRRQLGPFLRAVSRAGRGVRPAAPAMLPVPTWVRAMPRLMRTHGRRLGLVTLHQYALRDYCATRAGERPERKPGARRLVSPRTLAVNLRELAPAVRAARRAGNRVRISETNSAFCAGVAGVSNSQAAALWAIDWLFGLSVIGADGANFHASSPLYRPFGTWIPARGKFAGVVGPVYYGMLAFAEATAHRSRLLPSTWFARRPQGRRTNVTAWGTYDRARRVVRVVIVNKEPRRSGRAVVRVPGARGSAQIKRLTAPALESTSGFSWGGQAYAFPTGDAELEGTVRRERVPAGRRATYRLRLDAASAAMLTVRVPRVPRRPTRGS